MSGVGITFIVGWLVVGSTSVVGFSGLEVGGVGLSGSCVSGLTSNPPPTEGVNDCGYDEGLPIGCPPRCASIVGSSDCVTAEGVFGLEVGLGEGSVEG